MWPYSELGIEPTADERAIKRAYAVKLKQNRPDANPDGFQRLHEAYQAALADCRGVRPAPSVTTAFAERQVPHPAPVAATTDTPATSPSEPLKATLAPITFNADDFLHEAVKRADANDAGALRAWLESHEALWSLSLKARVGQRWLAVIHQVAPPMPESCFDEMLAFFQLDHAVAVSDPLLMAQQSQRMHLAWHLAPERRDALATLLGAATIDARNQTIRKLNWLERPFRWPEALWRSLIPQTVNTMSNLILRLTGQPPIELPPPINPRQQAFWLQAAHGGPFSRAGAAVIGARIAGALLLGLLLGLVLGAMAITDTGAFGWHLVGVMVAVAGGLSVVALVFIAWSQLNDWQRRFVPIGHIAGWLHLALVPLLALAALVITDVTDAPLAGWLLAVPALWLALARMLYGRQMADSLRSWLRAGIFLIYPISRLAAGAMEDPGTVGHVLVGATLFVWVVDAWRRYPFWRRSAA